MTSAKQDLPQNVDQAVDCILKDLSLNAEILLSGMSEEGLTDLHFSLAHYIRNEFGLWTGNEALMESCRSISGNRNLHVDDASMVIVKVLWERLKERNILEE